jgi:hypothetical protein
LRRSRSPAIACARITRATRLWFTLAPGGTPSLSSAVIRGTPCAVSVSWIARIRSVRAASASARAVRPGAAASQA